MDTTDVTITQAKTNPSKAAAKVLVRKKRDTRCAANRKSGIKTVSPIPWFYIYSAKVAPIIYKKHNRVKEKRGRILCKSTKI